MSFTTYREQQGTYASSHCRSEVLHTINTKQGRAQRSRASVKRTLSTRDKIFDVVVIVVWGASIPAVMWLGALCGL